VGKPARESETEMNQMDRIEWKLDQLLMMLRSGGELPVGQHVAAVSEAETKPAKGEEPVGRISDKERERVLAGLRRMTPKQHASMQMILNGKRNQEIAERMGVTLNTAKVYVRTAAKNLGVRRRGEIVRCSWPVMQMLDDETYRKMSGGLPINWDDVFDLSDPADDPFRCLYAMKTGPSYDPKTGKRSARTEEDEQ